MKEIVSYYKIENDERIEVSVDPAAAKKAYKEAIDANIRNFNLRVLFNNDEFTTSNIGSIKITSDLFGTDTFTIGSVISETLDMTIFRYWENVDTSYPVVPFISLRTEVEIVTELGVEIQEIWQETCMGIYYAVSDGVTDDGYNTTTIRASSVFSNPDLGDINFESTTTSNLNRDLYNIIDHILTDVNKKVSPNIYLVNDDLPDVSISDESGNIIDRPYKEIIEYIARLYGGYAKTYYDANADRVYLEFFRPIIKQPEQQIEYFYDQSNYMSYKRSKDFLNVQKISCTRGENDIIWVTQASSGTGETSSDGYHAIYIECADMTEELLRDMFNYYHGYIYHPMTSKVFGSPILEVGDTVRIRGRDTRAVGAEMPLHNITYNITGSGLTMDIKSVYKVNPVTVKKTVKSTLNDMNGRQDTLEEEMSLLKEKVEQLESGSSCDCGDRLDSMDTTISNLTSRVSKLETEVTNLWTKVNGSSGGGISMHNPHFSGVMSISKDQDTVIDQDIGAEGEIEATYYRNIEDVGLRLSGLNVLELSIHPNGAHSTLIRLYNTREGSSTMYHRIAFLAEVDGGNYSLSNMNITNTTSAQTDYTSSLISSGSNEHMIYSSMSYYQGELRWCWKETVFTYPECDIDPETDEWIYTGRNICYIEIPIFMAENIQNDYHINVSKMSWGDYRIIEKNPYYFILESQEEDFAFTFEVVATLNDNQTTNNNAIIANEGYEVLAEVNED